MDLVELITWAKSYDVSKIEQLQNKRAKASTYLVMIIDKGNAILRNTKQTEDYMKNIKEYLEQLGKINVSPKNQTPQVEHVPIKESQSPLIP